MNSFSEFNELWITSCGNQNGSSSTSFETLTVWLKSCCSLCIQNSRLKFSLRLGWDNLIIFQTYMLFVLKAWGLYKICRVYISKQYDATYEQTEVVRAKASRPTSSLKCSLKCKGYNHDRILTGSSLQTNEKGFLYFRSPYIFLSLFDRALFTKKGAN